MFLKTGRLLLTRGYGEGQTMTVCKHGISQDYRCDLCVLTKMPAHCEHCGLTSSNGVIGNSSTPLPSTFSKTEPRTTKSILLDILESLRTIQKPMENNQ